MCYNVDNVGHSVQNKTFIQALIIVIQTIFLTIVEENMNWSGTWHEIYDI